MIEGRHIADPVALLDALAARLNAAGAASSRLGFTVRHHPSAAARLGLLLVRGAKAAGSFSAGTARRTATPSSAARCSTCYENQQPFRRRLESLDDQRDPALLHELRAEGMTDYYALPLCSARATVNFMTVATAAPAGFSDDDLDRFEALANLLAPLLEIIQARRMTLGLLDAFVGPRISERILQGQVKRGDGDRIEAAFWYSDLRGFTALSESLPAARAAAAAERLFRELRRRRGRARRRDPAVHRRRDPDRVRDQAARGRSRGLRRRARRRDRRLRLHRGGQPPAPPRRPAARSSSASACTSAP